MVISINTNLLLAYYGVPTSLGANGSATAAVSTPTTPVTPWASAATQTQTNNLIQSALNGRSLFNASSVKLSIPTTTPNYGNTKQLFALYQGLTALQDLANQAKTPGLSSVQLSAVQTAFQGGMQQLGTYLNGAPFSGFTVALGGVAASQQTSAGALGETDTYTTRTLVSGDTTTPVPAFAGNVQFSMTVTLPSGSQTVVNFNLADMGSTPRSLSNVINYLNGQLAAAGVFTRFADVLTQGTSSSIKVNGQTISGPTSPNTYALQIVGNPIEQISLSAPTTSPGIYVTQQAGETQSSTGGGSTPAGNTTTPAVSQQLLKLTTDPSATSPRVFTDTLSQATQAAVATATAPDGSVYVLANIDGPTQSGLLNGSHGIVGAQDVALMKYDSAGNLIWTQTVGSTQTATGLGLAVSADGSQIAVVGQGTGLLDNDGGPPADTTDPTGFVSVFSSAGAPAWSQSVDGFNASAVSQATFGADGSLYVAGTTQLASGFSDTFLAGFSASGAPKFNTIVGPTASSGVSGIAVDGSSLVTAGDQSGQAVVQSYTLNGSGAPTLAASETLGQADVAGLAVNADGSIVVAGSTNNGALAPGATVANAYSGGTNAYVANLNAALSPSSADTITYFNGGADTTATAVTVAGGQVYLAGRIAATPTAGQTTAFDGYAAEVDPATGQITWSSVINTDDNESAPSSIAVSPTGSSALDALGLPSGAIDFSPDQALVQNTALQPGDQFTIKSNFGSLATITVQASDTLQSLAQEIGRVTGFAATAQVVTGTGGVQELKITPTSSSFQVTLGSGPAGQNALPALGLTDGLITANATAKAKSAIGVNGAKPTTTLQANYGLGLESTLSLATPSGVANALAQLGGAISTVKSIYSAMTTPPSAPGANGPVPAYLTAEIANYQAALARLTSGSGSVAI